MSSQGASGTDTGEKQVKFSLPKSGVGKVFSRSCSTAGVFKTSNTNSKSSATPLMSDRSLSGERHELNDIPEGKVSILDNFLFCFYFLLRKLYTNILGTNFAKDRFFGYYSICTSYCATTTR